LLRGLNFVNSEAQPDRVRQRLQPLIVNLVSNLPTRHFPTGLFPNPSTLIKLRRAALEGEILHVDFGDWQELSRLRFENHAWHRCIDAVLQAVDARGATSISIAEAVDHSVRTLNERLLQLHRRPASLRNH
jgi:hypothetical protein